MAAKYIIQKTLPGEKLSCTSWLQDILTREKISLDYAQVTPYFYQDFLNSGGDPLALFMELRFTLREHKEEQGRKDGIQPIIIVQDSHKAFSSNNTQKMQQTEKTGLPAKRKPSLFHSTPLQYHVLSETNTQTLYHI